MRLVLLCLGSGIFWLLAFWLLLSTRGKHRNEVPSRLISHISRALHKLHSVYTCISQSIKKGLYRLGI